MPHKIIFSYPGVEFECKASVDYLKPGVVTKLIINNIKSGNIVIDTVDSRKEYHHFYSNKNSDIHRAFIFVNGSKEIWIKEKSRGDVFYTPKHNIPILVRKEKKLKPTDRIYKNIFIDTFNWEYQGSFKKECIDISFLYKDYCFTVTFAEACNIVSIFSQIELEYDGHLSTTKKPTKKLVLILFDEVTCLLFSKLSTAFTTMTKLEWLRCYIKQ